jgi:hypothetical protein
MAVAGGPGLLPAGDLFGRESVLRLNRGCQGKQNNEAMANHQ